MNKAINQAVDENINQSPYARKVLTKLFTSMTKYPSESKKQTLEDMGFSVDYQNSDAGECLQKTNF